MSEKRGFSQRWGHLLLGGIIGGFVGAAADDLASWLFPASTDRWVAECEAMLEDGWDAGHRSFFIDGELCVAIVYPELPNRDLIRDDATDFCGSAYRTVLDAHDATLRAKGAMHPAVQDRIEAIGRASNDCFGADQGTIEITGDIISPVDVEWKARSTRTGCSIRDPVAPAFPAVAGLGAPSRTRARPCLNRGHQFHHTP